MSLLDAPLKYNSAVMTSECFIGANWPGRVSKGEGNDFDFPRVKRRRTNVPSQLPRGLRPGRPECAKAEREYDFKSSKAVVLVTAAREGERGRDR